MDHLLVAVFLALFTATGCKATPLDWELLPEGNAILRSRWFAGTVVYSNNLFVFGGQATRAGANDTGILGETVARNQKGLV